MTFLATDNEASKSKAPDGAVGPVLHPKSPLSEVVSSPEIGSSKDDRKLSELLLHVCDKDTTVITIDGVNQTNLQNVPDAML